MDGEENEKKKILAVTSRLFAWQNKPTPLNDESDNCDEKKKGKIEKFKVPNSQVLITIFTSLLIIVIMIWLTFVPFKKNANFVVAMSSAVCIFSFLSFYITRSDMSVHICMLTSVTMVQLTYSRFAVEIPSWTEVTILAIVALVFAIENIVMYYLVALEEKKASNEGVFTTPQQPSVMNNISQEIYNDQSLSYYYTYIITGLLLIGVIVPLPHVGIFNIRHMYLGLLFLIWPCFTISEEYKKNVLVEFVLPHSSIKGATLLYLHPYYWILVVLMIFFNVFMLKIHSKKVHE